MSYLVYLAAPGFNDKQMNIVKFIEKKARMKGIRVFSPFENSAQIFKGRHPMACTEEERAQVLSDNILYLTLCDVVWAWVGGMGGFTDPGVIWEMGFAYREAQARGGVPLTIAYVDDTDERQSMNLMLAGTVDCAVKGRAQMNNALNGLGAGASWKELKELYPTSALAGKEPVA